MLSGAESKGKRCIFEQFVFEPLWALHKCAFIDKDLERLKSLALKLGLTDCKQRSRVDEAFGEFMGEWLPLTDAIIKAICKFGRSPVKTFDTHTTSLIFIELNLFYTLKIQLDKNLDFFTESI